MLAIIALAAVVSGLVQGLTGFGAGIVLIVALSSFFDVVEAAGVAQAICLVVILLMFWRYRSYVSVRKVVPPLALFLAASWITVLIAQSSDQDVLKALLGVFLIVFALYKLFWANGEQKPLSLPVKMVCVVLAGICDGLFGIGGPPMVIYYTATTDGAEEYLGTLQAFFTVTTTCSLVFRLSSGALTVSALPTIGVGIVFVTVGLGVANRLVSRLDDAAIRRLTYGFMGVAGLYYAVSAAMVLLA